MQGKIIKGIAGFYYVQTEDKLYECKAKRNLPKQEDETVSRRQCRNRYFR